MTVNVIIVMLPFMHILHNIYKCSVQKENQNFYRSISTTYLSTKILKHASKLTILAQLVKQTKFVRIDYNILYSGFLMHILKIWIFTCIIFILEKPIND